MKSINKRLVLCKVLKKVIHSSTRFGMILTIMLNWFFEPFWSRFYFKWQSAATSFVQSTFCEVKSSEIFLQLFPSAMSQFDLSAYDLVLIFLVSAKGVRTKPNSAYCYCHSPMRCTQGLQLLARCGPEQSLRKICTYVLRKMKRMGFKKQPSGFAFYYEFKICCPTH
jgi:hypothetical protein